MKRRPPSAVWLLVLLLVLSGGGYLLYRLSIWPAQAAEKVRAAFLDVAHLQPRVTVNERVLYEQNSSALQLAVITRETHVEREVMHEWLGSKKRLRVRGQYRVQAGFDLTEPFQVNLADHTVSVQTPKPRILSVAQIDVDVTAFQNGLWNKINPKDIEEEFRMLPDLARKKASEAGIEAAAVEELTRQLRERLPEFSVDVNATSTPVLQPRPDPADE